MKLIRKYGFEILLGILGVAFFTGTLYIVLVMPEDLMVRGTIMFGLFFDAIAIYYVLRRLWRTKWSRRVVPAVQKLFEKLCRCLLGGCHYRACMYHILNLCFDATCRRYGRGGCIDGLGLYRSVYFQYAHSCGRS